MKIVFLCGSLEPGRDGVGDYTRQLACELISKGHQATIVSLHDHFISEDLNCTQRSGQMALPVLRLSSLISEKDRFKRAKEWINAFNPHWVSIQFVSYSFHSKGMPFGIEKYFKSLGNNLRWHIMFHELWIDTPINVKQHLVAFIQRCIIYSVAKILKPNIIHVSIPFNQRRLKSLGIKSCVLELFGNILKSNIECQIQAFKNSPSAEKKLLYFGSAPKGKYLEVLLEGLVSYCKKEAESISIVVVSSQTKEKNSFIAKLKEKLLLYQVNIIDLDFVESNDLSTKMFNCTVGIARSEPHLLGKSGSAIAMLEHGLPIWMPKWDGKKPIEFSFRTNLIFSKLEEAMAASSKLDYISLLPQVAEKFIKELKSS